jgi:hypothetical protein
MSLALGVFMNEDDVYDWKTGDRYKEPDDEPQDD